MLREDIVKLVIDTMKYYGSKAGERAHPGSRLLSQANHIADVIEQYDEACRLTASFVNVRVIPRI